MGYGTRNFFHADNFSVFISLEMIRFKSYTSKELTIQADDNYVIDAVIAGGKYQEITDKKSMKIKIDSSYIADTARGFSNNSAYHCRNCQAVLSWFRQKDCDI